MFSVASDVTAVLGRTTDQNVVSLSEPSVATGSVSEEPVSDQSRIQ